MDSAQWQGAYMSVSAGTMSVRNWLASLPDRSYDRTAHAWLVPIDLWPELDTDTRGIETLREPPKPARKRSLPLPERLDPQIAEALDLAPYQREGAQALLRGLSMLADAQGVGKTHQLTAAALSAGVERVVIVAPGNAIVDPWTEMTDLASMIQGSVGGSPAFGHVVPCTTRAHLRHVQDLRAQRRPAVVLTTPSALRSFTGALEALIEWRPDVLIVDEVHTTHGWQTQTAHAVRALASVVPVCWAATGTPVRKNAIELLTPLLITGDIATFGGLGGFLSNWARLDQYDRWYVPKPRQAKLLEWAKGHLWLRRTLDDINVEVPQLHRHYVHIDVDLATYRQAESNVETKIDEWILFVRERTGEWPNREDAKNWVHDRGIAFFSELVQAAGAVKLPVVCDKIDRWYERYGMERPVIIWGVHQDFLRGIASHLDGHDIPYGIIDGTVSAKARAKARTDFQLGKLAVLLASIRAAGTALTLTRSHDAVMGEVDWSATRMAQAESRIARRGQRKPPNVTYLLARGTIDEHIMRVIERDVHTITTAMHGDFAIAANGDRSRQHAYQMLTAMVIGRVQELRGSEEDET